MRRWEQPQAVYRVSELAQLAGVEKRRMARVLDRSGVEVRTVGGVRLVALTSLRDAWPDLWDSMVLRHDE